jgi:endonuclease YncB( thermonuclease family)
LLRLSARNAAAGAALALVAACACDAAAAKTVKPAARVIAGKASVVDGDGVEIQGIKIRLFGVDAPEIDQYCKRADGTRWRCGQYATVALDRLAGGKDLSCATRENDRYGRPVAVCKVDGRDLASELAREGWAFAYRKYSSDYVDEESAAKEARAGVWIGEVEAPWDYRRRGGAGRQP